MAKVVTLKRAVSEADAKEMKKSFVDESYYDLVVTEDTDGYNEEGELLFKYRSKAIPYDILKSGVDAFEDSIETTDGRGAASGSTHKRIRKDGTVSNISVGNKVRSGNVGYMDPSAMVRYCRKTAFARKYFEKFQQGIPFVEYISSKYEELCPEHFARQKSAADSTHEYYLIGNSVFSTVTVNENFRTAIHQDAGDFREGMGNLIVYREGEFEGCYFCLPEYRVAVDMQSEDLLFANVHKWHGNSAIEPITDNWRRISFVMYLREKIMQCDAPEKELDKTQVTRNGISYIEGDIQKILK